MSLHTQKLHFEVFILNNKNNNTYHSMIFFFWPEVQKRSHYCCPHLHFRVVDDHVGDLEVPVDEVVDLEVLVVVAEGIEQRLRHLDPPLVADELEDGEEGHVDGRGVVDVLAGDAEVDLWERVKTNKSGFFFSSFPSSVVMQ